MMREEQSPPLTFQRLRTVNAQRKVRWHTDGTREWSPLEWAGALCGEAGEAANVAKKILRIDLGLPGNAAAEHVITQNVGSTEREALVAKLADELAGTLLYVDLLAAAVGIDLDIALRKCFNDKSRAMGFPERL